MTPTTAVRPNAIPPNALRAEIDRRVTGLARARAAIAHLPQLDAGVNDRIADRLDNLLDDAARRVDGLRDDSAGAESANADADEVLRDCDEVLSEVLASLHGAASRWAGIDAGACALAEAWLDELSARADIARVGVVIPAEHEFLHATTQVIRLRFPDDGFWGLPVAVHEYGHFVAEVLVRRTSARNLPYWAFPVADLLREAAEEFPALWSIGHELFADAFAVFVAGPAYVNTCLRLRFDAARAHDESPTHPSAARRAQVQLRTLERMHQSMPGGGYLAGARSTLAEYWDAAVTAVGLDPAPPASEDLDALDAAFWDLLTDDRNTVPLRYTSYDSAVALAERLLESTTPLQPNDTRADVVNAAWVLRARHERNAKPDALPKLLDKISTAARAAFVSIPA